MHQSKMKKKIIKICFSYIFRFDISMYETKGVLDNEKPTLKSIIISTSLLRLTICLTANNNCLYNGAACDSVNGPP